MQNYPECRYFLKQKFIQKCCIFLLTLFDLCKHAGKHCGPSSDCSYSLMCQSPHCQKATETFQQVSFVVIDTRVIMCFFHVLVGFCKNDKNHEVYLLVEAFSSPESTSAKSRKVGEGKVAIYPRPTAPKLHRHADPGEDYYNYTDIMSLLRTNSSDHMQMHCGRIRNTYSFHEVVIKPPTPVKVRSPPPRTEVLTPTPRTRDTVLTPTPRTRDTVLTPSPRRRETVLTPTPRTRGTITPTPRYATTDSVPPPSSIPTYRKPPTPESTWGEENLSNFAVPPSPPPPAYDGKKVIIVQLRKPTFHSPLHSSQLSHTFHSPLHSSQLSHTFHSPLHSSQLSHTFHSPLHSSQLSHSFNSSLLSTFTQFSLALYIAVNFHTVSTHLYIAVNFYPVFTHLYIAVNFYQVFNIHFIAVIFHPVTTHIYISANFHSV